VGPLLKFLETSHVSFTIIVPQLYPLPFWWPVLRSRASSCILVESKGDFDVLLFPSPNNLLSRAPYSGICLRSESIATCRDLPALRSLRVCPFLFVDPTPSHLEYLQHLVRTVHI